MNWSVLATIDDMTDAEQEAVMFTTTPVLAIRKLLSKNKM